MPATTIDERIETAERRADQQKARAQKLRALKRKRNRRLDARSKIILGGAVLALNKSGDPSIRDMMPQILAAVTRDSDRATLQDVGLL